MPPWAGNGDGADVERRRGCHHTPISGSAAQHIATSEHVAATSSASTLCAASWPAGRAAVAPPVGRLLEQACGKFRGEPGMATAQQRRGQEDEQAVDGVVGLVGGEHGQASC